MYPAKAEKPASKLVYSLWISFGIFIVARSPLYTHLSATLSGLPTIRALGKEEVILREFYNCQDHQAEGWLMFIKCARWFTYRLDLIATLFAICAIFAPIIAVRYSGM